MTCQSHGAAALKQTQTRTPGLGFCSPLPKPPKHRKETRAVQSNASSAPAHGSVHLQGRTSGEGEHGEAGGGEVAAGSQGTSRPPGLTQKDDGLPPGCLALLALGLVELRPPPLPGHRALAAPPEHLHHVPAHEGHRHQHHEVDDEGAEDAGLEDSPAAGKVGADGHVGRVRLLVVPRAGAVAREPPTVIGHAHQGVLDPHGKKQRQRHQGGGDPDKTNQQLHLARPRHGLIPEGVADGDVALKAERQHVQQRGVAAGLEEESVNLTGQGIAGRGQGVPDDAVELHGHADEEDQDVGASQAHHVIRHLLLQVTFLLQHLGDPNGDTVPQDAHHEDGQVHQDEGDFDPGGHLELRDMGVIDNIGAVAVRSHGDESQATRSKDLSARLPPRRAQGSGLQLTRAGPGLSHSRSPERSNLVFLVLSWKLPGAAQLRRGPGGAWGWSLGCVCRNEAGRERRKEVPVSPGGLGG